MNDDKLFERAVDDWLEAGSDRTPRPAVDAVLLAIRTTPQERDLRIPWRNPTMSNPLRLVAAIAIIAVVGVLGLTFLRPAADPGVGGAPTPNPTATPRPTAAPSASLSPAAPMPPGELGAGTYVVHPHRGSLGWQVTVPDGWSNGDDWYLYPTSLGGPEGPDGAAAVFLFDPEVFVDSCDGDAGMTDTGTVAELVEAIQAKADWVVSAPTDATIGGYSGQRLDVELPADLSVCGDDFYLVFGEPGTENGFYAQGPSHLFRAWILDVDGQTIGLVRNSFAATPADKVAEAEAIIGSSVITP